MSTPKKETTHTAISDVAARQPVIVDAARTPFGGFNGTLRELHAQDLASIPLEALVNRNNIRPEDIDDVIYGCVTAADDQGLNIGRLAALTADIGDHVPGVHVNRLCGAGQEAVAMAARTVAAGEAEVVIAGGVEHMTRVPMGSDGAAKEGYLDHHAVSDTYFEYYDEIIEQGEAAERLATEYGFSRRELDQLAVRSHQRWQQAWEAGRYADQIVPVETTLDGEPIQLEVDEHPRPGTDVDALSELPLAFRDAGNGVHHAGNSSGIVDGAAAIIVTTRRAATKYNWDPMAEVIATDSVGIHPNDMGKGPIPATEAVLETTNLDLADIDLFEVNEAFASVLAAWLVETGVSIERVNTLGGAIAHGHPLGATGAMMLGKLAHELSRGHGTHALSTMGIGFGQGIATVLRRA